MRATDPSRATVTREDIENAQELINDWAAHVRDLAGTLNLPYLRGLITQALADAHAQGYDEGVVRGRRLIANTVRDALDGEGL